MQDSSEKKTINVMDAEEHAAAQAQDVQKPELAPQRPEMSDEVSAVESEKEVTSPLVDNDHSLDDVRTQNQLSTTSAALAKEKTKRRSKPLLVFLLALLMTVLGAAAGVMVYKSYFEKQPAPQTKSSAQPVVSTSNPTAAELVAGIKPALKGTVVPTGTRTDNSVMTSDNYEAYSVPTVQPTGYNFETAPTELSGVSTSATAQSSIDADVLAAKQYLEAKGLKASKTNSDQVNNLISSTDYTSDTVKCRVSETNYSNTFQSHIGCADVSSYSANAKTIEPFYTLLVTAMPDVKQPGLRLGLSTVKPSKTSGYKTAEVSTSNSQAVGGFASLFYQTPDATWHFFKGSQNMLMCTDYNTPDLKKAYLGTACGTPDGKESMVSL